ncbi:chromosome transmission fidelity protein 18 homolog isoform X1 [Mycetomoellerius zeteki]|uniref:chromosome transmission fidelity protein 18 homolog isoform X1 n=1 Tax=Mycetomoellerius zeteki TaxID=64791 RepID=UPI00084ECD20|nr:PREDICTED: chromosome transmission fidelity protein 18 homolog isoform X1 [Trachymyrmex zeteki]XP_018307582.1 PREDICTED: chromosome transmission fidelity protein 18 homolog isoform X1 [Trachymyrmex zeteki]
MTDEYPDLDMNEEFDLIHKADYEALRELEGELFEKRQLPQSDPSPSNSGTSWIVNNNKHQANVEISAPDNVDKVNNMTNNNKNHLLSQSDPGPSTSGISWTANDNKHQSNVEIPVPVNADKINNITSNNKTHSYEKYCDSIPSSSKKRNCEEFLSDSSNLLDMDIPVDTYDANIIEEPKEKKLRWDQPKKVIKKILDVRQLLHENENTPMKISYNNKKNSISLRVPSWNFVAVTRSYDSQRLYIRVRNQQNNIKQSTSPIANLSSVPYKQLKIQAKEIMARKQDLSRQPLSLCDTTNIINDELWVDKYRPRSYIELLSDETVNRQLLHWLKLWDKVVFKKNVIKPKKKLPNFGKKNNIDDKKDIEEVDSKGYPIKRIALLSGPPGLGKTTLAHIAARHAGYNVVEVNASDERTPDTFRQILLASTEMKAVMGADPRPNCLIFDEIDGAPAASIELLLKFTQGKLITKKKKKKEQSENMSDGCTRPVICICNEPYAPSLRALRAVSVIIPIQEVSPLRLAERLMDLARKEKLNVDFNDLVKIAERSGCDVRACIGALQYMGSSNLKDNLSLGLKDTRKNLFDSWRSILTIPMNKEGVLNISERIQNILKTVQNGETDKLTQGIFHNYPEICDRKLNNVPMSLEWFQFYDLVISLIAHKQIWSLMPYTNYGFIAWHLYLARTQKMKISYPTVTNEVTQKSAKNTGILTAVRRVCGRDVFTLTTDIAGFLPDILTPKLRTVPSHLYSSKEKSDLARIINVMLEFGLSFVQEKNFQRGYIYNLDPNILEIGVFLNCNAHRSLAYAVQQIITQELEVERLKRASILTGLGVNSENMAKSGNPETVENVQNISSNVENNTKQSRKNATSLKEIVYKDFFGNIITNENKNGQKQNKIMNRISPKSQEKYSLMKNILTKHGIWYKYKEGCNNAVRRNVSMEKFL